MILYINSEVKDQQIPVTTVSIIAICILIQGPILIMNKANILPTWS
jgi:hypothetical protein